MSFLFISFETNGQNMDSINNFLGKYSSYKWFDLPVTGMLYPEANSYIGKKMIINKNSFVLFSDTLKDVKYEFRKCEQIEFFREFRHFDYRKLKIAYDSIKVISVTTPESDFNPPIDIILTKDFFVTEYMGYFYFFKRGNQKKTSRR
jgi:hypothetical protein